MRIICPECEGSFNDEYDDYDGFCPDCGCDIESYEDEYDEEDELNEDIVDESEFDDGDDEGYIEKDDGEKLFDEYDDHFDDDFDDDFDDVF